MPYLQEFQDILQTRPLAGGFGLISSTNHQTILLQSRAV